MSDNAHYTIPKPPGRWRAITLALVMHVALFLFFWIGIRWQSETPLTVEAEIWDPQYKEAAPLPTPPQPQPEPDPVIEPPKPEHYFLSEHGQPFAQSYRLCRNIVGASNEHYVFGA